MTQGHSLEVSDLAVNFGGVAAINGVSFVGAAGKITGLIGPNGAGKTTTFNVCTGQVKPNGGSVTLNGVRLEGQSPSKRAQMGLGRTFQRIELCDSLTVFENVSSGPEALLAGRQAWRQLWAPPRERAKVADRAMQALDHCQIAHLRKRTTGELSTGERRLVELARAVASEFRYLLLDEPSSGLDEDETVMLGSVLLDCCTRTQMGMLVIEHDMALIRQTCVTTHVLEFGRIIESGATDSVLAGEIVRAAYLGVEVTDQSA
jgi:ABC-type branched-subunit amino acid transport system ATPase component